MTLHAVNTDPADAIVYTVKETAQLIDHPQLARLPSLPRHPTVLILTVTVETEDGVTQASLQSNMVNQFVLHCCVIVTHTHTHTTHTHTHTHTLIDTNTLSLTHMHTGTNERFFLLTRVKE